MPAWGQDECCTLHFIFRVTQGAGWLHLLLMASQNVCVRIELYYFEIVIWVIGKFVSKLVVSLSSRRFFLTYHLPLKLAFLRYKPLTSSRKKITISLTVKVWVKTPIFITKRPKTNLRCICLAINYFQKFKMFPLIAFRHLIARKLVSFWYN